MVKLTREQVMQMYSLCERVRKGDIPLRLLVDMAEGMQNTLSAALNDADNEVYSDEENGVWFTRRD